MRHQAIRPIALMLCALLVAAVPAQAGTLHFTDVLRAGVGRGNASPDLRLRAIQKGGQATAAGVTATGQGKAETNPSSAPVGHATAPDGSVTHGSTVSLVAQDPAQQQQGGTVETVDLGDITGTVCDCGEIPIESPGRRIPPWIWLAGVPLICLTGICTPDDECVVNCEPTSTPTPTPPPIPEPTTLLLLGSGLLALGARARRRRPLQNPAEKADGTEVV